MKKNKVYSFPSVPKGVGCVHRKKGKRLVHMGNHVFRDEVLGCYGMRRHVVSTEVIRARS